MTRDLKVEISQEQLDLIRKVANSQDPKNQALLRETVITAVETFIQKRNEYGDTDEVVVGAIKALYPKGIPKERYYEALFAFKILEKLSRLSSTSLTAERLRDAFKDVVGYGLLGVEQYSADK